MLKIALYQPDIPQNVGAMIRLCACMGVGLEMIEPASFPWDERKIKQSAMDYMKDFEIKRHTSWDAFRETYGESRVILMTTKAATPYTAFRFKPDDILLAGSESAGVPQTVHESVDERILIPMEGQMRSLNIVNATSMILSETLRQTRWSMV